MKKTNINVNGFTQGLLLCAALITTTNVAANPSGATVIHGNVSFSHPNANTLNITNTPGAIINWQQFGIAEGELTRFNQQSASSTVLNRVTGQDPSKILGSLTSNGRVFLINPNGVMFGQNAIIDTAGLIASTLGMSDRDFLNGNLHFEDLTNASEILNKGFIHTSNAGEVVLVAPNIRNEGTINVEQGKLVLAAGQSVTVSSLNHKNITFEVQAPGNKVVNIGKLMSDGGSIGVFAGSIRNTGVISANAITVNDAGQIVLLAKGDNLQQSGTVTTTSKTGKGGHIEILGERVGLFGKSVADASGKTGGGEVLVGGDYQGKNKNVKNAKQTIVSKQSQIHADAKSTGDGGKTIVWADGQTGFNGSATAKAGEKRGDGGLIEVSGKEGLLFDGYVNASAKNGKAGTILFDPKNITVSTLGTPNPGGTDDGLLGFAELGAGTNLVIDAAAITAIVVDNLGNLELQANNDITIDRGVAISSSIGTSGDLILTAGRSIFLNNVLSSDGTLVLNANDAGADPQNRGSGAATILSSGLGISNGITAGLDGNGGSLTIRMGTGGQAGDISLGSINASDLLIDLNGTGGTIFINNTQAPFKVNGPTQILGDVQIAGDVDVFLGSLIVTGTSSIAGDYTQTGGMVTFEDTATFNTVNLTGNSALNFTLNGINNVIASLNISHGNGLPQFSGTGNTSVTGNTNWGGGVVSHTLTFDGNLNLTSGTGGLAIIDGDIVTLNGTATVGDNFSIDNGGRFINNGKVNNGSDVGLSGFDILSSNGSGIFENNGQFVYGGTGNASIDAVLINEAGGTLNVGNMNVSLTNDGSEWNGGVFSNAIQGDGVVFGGNGSLTIDSNITLNTAATKTIDFLDVIFPTTGTMTIVGDGDVDITNSGRLVHQNQGGGGSILFATIRHQSNGDIISSDATGTFVNEGRFINEAGDTEISADFENDGIANGELGTVIRSDLNVIAGSVKISGNYTSGTNANVLVDGGELILAHSNASPMIDSADYTFTGGDLTVLSDTNFSGSFLNGAPTTVRFGNSANVMFSGDQSQIQLNNVILEGGANFTSFSNVFVNGVFDWIEGSVNSSLNINSGAMANISMQDLVISGSFLTNNGTFKVLNGGSVQFQSATNGTGEIDIASGGLVELNSFGDSHSNRFNIAQGGTLDIIDGLHTFNEAISGEGTLHISNASFAGVDLLMDSTAGTLIMEGGILTGDGNLSLSQRSTWSGGIMEFGGGGVTNFNGEVDITGAVNLDRVVNVAGGSINNGMIFNFSESQSSETGNSLGASQAAFNIIDGVFVVMGDSAIQSPVTISGGALDVAGTLTANNGVNNTGGVIQGTGTIVGNVENDAMLSPGNSPGTLTIDGNLILLSSSILNLEIAGSDLFDQLVVSGNMEFGGELAIFVDTTSGFNGTLNDEFAPFQFGSSSNSFSLVSARPEGFAFDFDGRTLVLTNLPGLKVLVPENDSLVFTSTLETFIDPFIDTENKKIEDEDDKKKTLVCS